MGQEHIERGPSGGAQPRRASSDASDPVPTRARQRQETRALIFEAAMREISEVGLAAARIERIARRAGVSRPTFYAHFPSKEDVLRELQTRTERSTLQALKTRLGEGKDAGGVHELIDAVFDLNEGADPVLRREAFGLMVREPGDARWIDSALFAFVRARLEEARQRGEIASSVDTGELTGIVMTALFGFVAIEGPPAPERRARAHELIRLLVAGAATTRPR